MTVLTFPSTGFKSDKVPLVDHVDADATASAASRSPQPQPPPPYDPKLLESGGRECGGDGDAARRDRYRLWTCRVAKLLLALLVCALIVWLSRDSFCDVYKDGASAMGLRTGAAAAAAADQAEDDDDDGGSSSSVPCKSYTSYAAAENDMMMPPPVSSSPSDYDAASQFNAMEDVYKKLENFALNKALALDDGGDDKDRIISSSGGGDVISMFNEDFDIAATGREPAAPVLVTKSARFIHDFSVNVTGIVDVEGQRCFVMPLVRNSVSPPASLYDLLLKMSSGYYSMDITKVMADMRVVKPALKDLSDYGLYISKDCADYSTFRLEKAVSVPAARL